LVDELVDREVTSANAHLYLTTFDLHHDLSLSKLVNPVRLTHEHDLELVPVREVVYVLSQLPVHNVAFHGDVHGNAGFQVDDVRLQRFDLDLGRLQLLEDGQGAQVSIVALHL